MLRVTRVTSRLAAGLRVTSRSHGSGCPDLIQVLRYLKMDLLGSLRPIRVDHTKFS